VRAPARVGLPAPVSALLTRLAQGTMFDRPEAARQPGA
jgi:hypothetical protein